jgi:hypothetical protein
MYIVFVLVEYRDHCWAAKEITTAGVYFSITFSPQEHHNEYQFSTYILTEFFILQEGRFSQSLIAVLYLMSAQLFSSYFKPNHSNRIKHSVNSSTDYCTPKSRTSAATSPIL